MTKPTDVLRWADTPTTLRTEPADATKNTGFSVNDKLAAQYFNWIAGVSGDWVTWLDDRLYDGYTVPTSGSDCLLYGDPDEGLEVKNAAGTRLPARSSESWLGAAGATRLKDSSGELRVTNAADALVPVHGSAIYGTNYRLDADYTSTIAVPLGSGHPTELGGVGSYWKMLAGTPPDSWTSTAASGTLAFEVQVPQGAKIFSVSVDWQPHAASPGTKMRFSAQRHTVALGANGDAVSGETYVELLSTTYLSAAASTDRKWGLMLCDQNNGSFTSVTPAVDRVRIKIEASTESGADFVYGVYVTVIHRSVGHLSLAPNVT